VFSTGAKPHTVSKFPRLNIAAQLIVPFIAISLITTVWLGISNVLAMDKALFDSLDARSQIITQLLSNELSDPLSMGEYDHMQSILVSTQKLDHCLCYAVIVAADGRVLASLDPSVMHVRLNRDEFERSALTAEKYLRRKTRYANVFEIVTPVMTSSGDKGGVLRAGFSTSTAEETMRTLALEILIIGALALIAGISIYVVIIRESIIQPISNVVSLATKISEGDLSKTVETTRSDEIGQLLKAEGEMVRCLRAMANIAESIADGDLSVHVDVRSEADVFGKAFEKMVASLNRQSKEIRQLAAIVEYSEDAIFSITNDGKIISWNKGAQKLFGHAAPAIVGQSVELLLLAEDRETFFSLIGNAFDDVPLESYETVNVRCDGSTVHVALSVSPVKTQTDKVVAVSVIARDITHKKIVEERMKDFYSIVSHELRTPLTSIRGALGLLAGGVVAADSQEGTDLILTAKSSTERLGRLINDILDLRKVENGQMDLNITSVDSTDLVNNAVDAMRGMAQDRAVSLWTDCSHRCILTVDMDRATQVMTNLISNAIKYSDAGGAIHVSAALSEKPGMLRFSIKDQGPGIAEDVRHKLFRKFQQIDSSDTRAKEGTGLGLAISKAIVEQHGGTIGMDGALGLGSTFWFELPISAERLPQEPPTESSILVIEDDLDLCAVLKIFLNAEGYHCDFANTLAEARQRLERQNSRPAVILLDLGLPDGNGLELVEFTRRSNNASLASIPIIIISGMDRDPRENYGALIVDWLSKPFDHHALRRALTKARRNTDGKVVLVVEDDADTRLVVMKELAELGVNCVAACNGSEAIVRAAECHPDLVILDVSMPDMDGFAVIENLKDNPNPPPAVLVYTGRELDAKDRERLHLGLTRYVLKGAVSHEEFLQVVRQLLERALNNEKVMLADEHFDPCQENWPPLVTINPLSTQIV
jgi:PAS domain S-box-containing protein